MSQAQKTVAATYHAERVAELQALRRELLAKRCSPGGETAEMKIRLDIVRAELHVLYQYLAKPRCENE
jgi:hypothetical protein